MTSHRPVLDTLCALAASALLVGFTAWGIEVASDPRDGYAPASPTGSVLPTVACATEDSTSCYWDADERGNGQGRSFTTDANDVVTYWEK